MNINRDYLIINDVKKSNIKLDNGSMFFYITDKNTQNIFVNLVINISNNELIQKFANIENAEDYTLTMNIVKPSNTYKVVEGKLHDKEKAIFEFNLNEDCCDEIGTYRCELLTKCNIDGHDEITTSNKLTYKVKSSVLNDLDGMVEAPEYPLVIQLFDKLSDINQYEEDRRANELARQLAEEQRQAKHDELVSDMTNSIQEMDDKVTDIDNRISTKEQAVDKLINDTKADIDEYKSAKDTEINNAITAQDNKIDTAINTQNDRITVVENNDVAQDNRLNALENRATLHESRLADVEAKNTQQDNRLDIIENKNQQQDNRLDAVEAKNVEQDNRLDEIEAIDVSQNNRLDAIEAKNQQQDDRLLDIEKVNKRQDMNLKCLFAESKNNMIDITEEGNSIYLQNSTIGYTLIDEIKGNTLVNCNKEPDKELILNGNINTSGDNTVTITEGVDGGKVDVSLEGNTLVNVSKTKYSTALPLEEELTYLYANTQYTVQFVSDEATTADITLGGTQLLAQSIVDGLNRITITTPATLVDNKLVINGIGANISEVVVTDTDKEFGYFEGMKSVGECEDLEVISRNRNLFDMSNLEYIDNYNQATISIDDNVVTVTSTSDITWCYHGVKLNNLKPNTTYSIQGTILSSPTAQTSFRIFDFKTNGANLSILFKDKATFTTPQDVSKLGLLFYISTKNECSKGDVATFTSIQIEEGSTATDYIPHQLNTQQLTHEPLRAVGNVKDKYTLIDGKWYIERNCKEMSVTEIKNISGNARIDSTTYDTCNDIRFFVNEPLHVSDSELYPQLFSDFKYRNGTGVLGEAVGEAVIVPGNTTIFIFHFSKDITIVDDFVSIYGNSKVVFPITTPVYEPINYNPLEVYSGTTHITTNSIIPTNITVKNHGFNCLLKPSTTYTISSSLGLNTVTTPSTLTEDCLRFMDTDTSDITTMKNVLILEGDWTTKADLILANFSGMESAFEQEYDTEKGKYKVNIKVANEDKTKENNITFFINEPLRGIGDVKDKVYVKNDKVVVERNCGIRAYEDGDFGTYLTDKVNTVYQLPEPTYEEVEYNDTKLFIESFKNSTLFYNSNIPVTSKLYYSYSVPIVDTVAQTASISDQQDSMIIDLATQVAVMEMMLM